MFAEVNKSLPELAGGKPKEGKATRVTFCVMKFGRYVTVDDGGNYVTVYELNVRRIIRRNESLGRLSSTNSVKNETS